MRGPKATYTPQTGESTAPRPTETRLTTTGRAGNQSSRPSIKNKTRQVMKFYMAGIFYFIYLL